MAGLAFLSTIPLAPIAANAADLYRTPPPPPAYAAPAPYVAPNSWAGFYVGINGGYGWSDAGNTIGYSGGFADGDLSGRAQPQGGFGGGQIGYNFYSGGLVFGVETDFQGGDIGESVTSITAAGNDFTGKERVDWFGTARGRLGYAFGGTLVYGTGGFAYGDVHQRASVTDGINSAVLSNDGTQTGWVAGGGIEFKINPAWSLKGEYQYIDLGSEKLTDAANTFSTDSLDTSFQTVRLGLNYRFGGGGYEPLQ
ncbi:MAG: porin family protein [Rhodomicrobium sp.]|nr:porin family protein [Rhodomicrobium sp.]